MTVPENWRVVVLTHDEPAALIMECIRSILIAAQGLESAYPGSKVSLRVMDDSQPGMLQQWRPQAEALGVEYRHAPGSIAQKRNDSWQDASVDVIAFTDADCRVDPDWLRAHAQVYATVDQAAGVIGVTRHQVDYSTGYRAAEYAGFLVGFRFPELMPQSYWGPCSNLSVLRSSLEQIGGFDSVHFSNAAEDVDLGLRLTQKTGRLLSCAREAIVQHEPESFAHGILRRAWSWGGGEAALMTRHRQFCIPRPPPQVIYWLTAAILAICGLILGTPGLAVAWLLVYGLLGPWVEAQQHRMPVKVISYARGLQAAFQLSMLLGLVRRGQPRLIGRKMNYGEGQLRYEWNGLVGPMWEFLGFVLFGALLSWGLW